MLVELDKEDLLILLTAVKVDIRKQERSRLSAEVKGFPVSRKGITIQKRLQSIKQRLENSLANEK